MLSLLPDLCNTERFRSRCAFDHYLGQSVKRQQAKKKTVRGERSSYWELNRFVYSKVIHNIEMCPSNLILWMECLTFQMQVHCFNHKHSLQDTDNVCQLSLYNFFSFFILMKRPKILLKVKEKTIFEFGSIGRMIKEIIKFIFVNWT